MNKIMLYWTAKDGTVYAVEYKLDTNYTNEEIDKAVEYLKMARARFPAMHAAKERDRFHVKSA